MKQKLSQEEQYRKMTETPVGHLIVSLSGPTIISMLVTNIYNMADTYFVSGIGTSASGATGVVFGLMAILQAFGFMFGHGAGSNISRLLGARHVERARSFSADSFWLSIAFGFLILVLGMTFMNPLMRLLGSTDTILPYARDYAFWILISGPVLTSSCVMNNILRYEGKAFFAMIGLTSGGILNIFGDAVLIRVFGMGIYGAGLSTAVSQIISFFILLVPFLQGQTQSSFHPKYFRLSGRLIRNILFTGTPSLVRQSMNSISTMVLNHAAGPYGDAAIAAISIVSRVVMFLNCVTIGIGQGFQPVSAFNFGAKKYSRVKGGYLYALKMAMILMSVMSVLAFIFAPQIIGEFRNDPEVISIGAHTLRVLCFAIVISPLAVYGDMMFQSIGRSGTATVLSGMRRGFLLIPLVILMTQLFGLRGLEWSQGVADIAASLVALPVTAHFLRHLPPDEAEPA